MKNRKTINHEYLDSILIGYIQKFTYDKITYNDHREEVKATQIKIDFINELRNRIQND